MLAATTPIKTRQDNKVLGRLSLIAARQGKYHARKNQQAGISKQVLASRY
jgi:hypothetical protein